MAELRGSSQQSGSAGRGLTGPSRSSAVRQHLAMAPAATVTRWLTDSTGSKSPATPNPPTSYTIPRGRCASARGQKSVLITVFVEKGFLELDFTVPESVPEIDLGSGFLKSGEPLER